MQLVQREQTVCLALVLLFWSLLFNFCGCIVIWYLGKFCIVGLVSLVIKVWEESEENRRVEEQQSAKETWITAVNKQQLSRVNKNQKELCLKFKSSCYLLFCGIITCLFAY